MFKKIVLPGLVSGVVITVVGMAVSMLIGLMLPGLSSQYQNAGLFRPWSDPKMQIFFAYPFLLGLGLAYVWDKVKGSVSGNIWKRTWTLMLGVFVISTIPGMTITYSTFTVSLLMVMSWTLGALVQLYLAGVILAKMNG